MAIASGCHAKLLATPSKLCHEMEDVESIIVACCRLMDAAEGSFMRETRCTPPLFPYLDVATLHAEAVESSIQNIHYVGVVLLM